MGLLLTGLYTNLRLGDYDGLDSLSTLVIQWGYTELFLYGT